MIAYLDTHIVGFLAQGKAGRIGRDARRLIEQADLLISPMVVIELEVLHEIGRIKPTAEDVLQKVERELGTRVCTLPFPRIAEMARDEKWTRDPFDRIIVAQAKANGLAYLISADDEIAKHHSRAVW